MATIKFRTLTSDDEIEKYLSKFEGYVGVKLPYDYAARSRIIGGFIGEEMVAGYMLCLKPEFRSLVFVPDQVKREHEFFQNETYEMMEINGLWIGAALKRAGDQFQVWRSVVLETFAARKKYILIMSNARNMNVKHMYSLTGSKLLYEGAPMTMAGMTTSLSTIRLSYTTRWALLLNMPRYWMEYKRRERRFAKRLKASAFAKSAKAG